MSPWLLSIVVVVATGVAVAIAAAGGVLAAEGRAQDGADAAALAAVTAVGRGADAAAAARSGAAAHGAELVACDCRGRRVRVRVRAPVTPRAARLLGIRSRGATATAALVSPRPLGGIPGP